MTKSINRVRCLLFSLECLSYLPFLWFDLAPRMLEDLIDIVTLGDIAIKHTANEVDALFAEDERDPKITVHNLVDAIKGILLIYDGI